MTLNGSTSRKQKGVGIIGAGVIFDAHARAWAALGQRARCFAIAEIDEEKRAAATQSHFLPIAVEDYRELLKRDDLDVICICTPPCFHEKWCATLMLANLSSAKSHSHQRSRPLIGSLK